MNPIDVYKRLPRTNCGACRQKACMPFAFALLNGEADISGCPELTETERDGMTCLAGKTDWREELISKLKEEIGKITLDDIAPDLGAEFRDGRLLMRCFGRNVTVGAGGDLRAEGILPPWMRMLVLFYIKNGGVKRISGDWVSHGELKGGLVKYKAFRKECEDPLRNLFDGHFRETASFLDRYEAVHPEGFSTRHSWLVHVFPRLPVLFLYWPADDEFGSQVSIRFDSTADLCFDVEQLIFLVEEIVHEIEASL